jgi:hypothetical protein
MSLRDQLSAKVPRTVTVQVQVSDPGPAREVLTAAEKRHTLLDVMKDTAPDKTAHRKSLVAAKKALDDARAAVAEHFVDVVFVAAKPADVDKVFGDHVDAKGEWDEAATVPHLAALCAQDPELQDPTWWDQQLNGGVWARGERSQLWTALIGLNIIPPSKGLPKG